MPDIRMPEDFPSVAFDSLHQSTVVADAHFRSANNGTTSPDWLGVAAAMNGVTYRWRALGEAQDAFYAAYFKVLKSPDDRYAEETALFSFFTNGVSALELSYFAFCGFAAQIEPVEFPLLQKRPRDIVPKLVTESFEAKWTHDSLTTELRKTYTSQAFKDLLELRNVLSHRAAPPRNIAITLIDTLGGAPVPQPPPTTTWSARPMDENLLPLFRSGIASSLSSMFVAASNFANEQVKSRYPQP